MARPFLRDAGQLAVHEIQVLLHPVADREHHLVLTLPHPHIDLRRISLRGLGNIVEIMDESRPAYQLESLYRQYRGTLIGDYIKTFLKRDLTVVEKKALYYGLQALLTTKVLTSDRKRI